MTIHTAIVTGANHGIGAATAAVLGDRGCAVLCTFLRVQDPPDPGVPQAYRDRRAEGAEPVAARIRAGGGRAVAVEADLSDPAVPKTLFDAAEEQFGPVDILVNNATGRGDRLPGVRRGGADHSQRDHPPLTGRTALARARWWAPRPG